METLLNYTLFFEAINEMPTFIKNLKVGQSVYYQKDGYNKNAPREQQKDKVGYDKIEDIDYNKGILSFKDHDGKVFHKVATQIFQPIIDTNGNQKVHDELQALLKKNSLDETKMRKILTYVEYIDNQK